MAGSESRAVFEYEDFSTCAATTVEYGEWIATEDPAAVHHYTDTVHIRTKDGDKTTVDVTLKRGSFFEHLDRNTGVPTLWQLADIISEGPMHEPHLRAKYIVVFAYNELYISDFWALFTKNKPCFHISDIRRCLEVATKIEGRNPYWWNNGFVRLEQMYIRPDSQTERAAKGFFAPVAKSVMTSSELAVLERRDELLGSVPDSAPPDAQLSDGARRVLQASLERSGSGDPARTWQLTEEDARNPDSEEAMARRAESKAVFDKIVDDMATGLMARVVEPSEGDTQEGQ